MKNKNSIPFALSLEIADVERNIDHMEADLSFHQSQVRLFEESLQENQKELEKLRKHHYSHFHCNESSDNDE